MKLNLKFLILCLAVFGFAWISELAWPAGAAAEETGPCDAPENAQFDFWVGQWAVYVKDREVGRNTISRIQGGCTLLEEYNTKPGGFSGKSFNYYDPTDTSWHQIWVDNAGTRLHLRGGYSSGKMVMSGTRQAKGQEVLDRITWHNNPEGTVRQVWEQSPDGGQNWQVVFDGLYRPLH